MIIPFSYDLDVSVSCFNNSFKTSFASPTRWNLCVYVLTNFSWININMGNFCIWSEMFKFPVKRSSKRAPILINRSHSVSAIFAAYVPCMPAIPRKSGWSPGKLPKPKSVFVTGNWYFSANCFNSQEGFSK